MDQHDQLMKSLTRKDTSEQTPLGSETGTDTISAAGEIKKIRSREGFATIVA